MITFLKILFIFVFLLLNYAVGSEIRDFKVALMYYSEAYLQGATLGGLKLEGEHSDYVAKKIYSAINQLSIENWNEEPWKTLKNFGQLLEAGNDISKRLTVASYCGSLSEHNIMDEAKRLQDYFINLINENEGIILPSGWQGHAIVLIIKPGQHADTYDLTVVNTGSGIGYHHHIADPNGIYPLLSRVWVEFKGIPKGLLFTDEAWFLQGLIALSWKEFVDKVIGSIKKNQESLSIYYYTSFLANFEEYLVPINEGKNVQIPMQRSGSCTISSILGALLYESKDEKSFHLYRNKIGNFLVNEVLENAEGNNELIRVISDGFDANGRIFMKGLLSSMAHNVLQYLETAMPTEFQHAGLIGSSRSSWLYEKKQDAIKALSGNKEALKLLAETIKTSNAVIKFLDCHRVRKNSTLVEVKSENLRRLIGRKSSEGIGELVLTMDKKYLDTDVNEFIKGTPFRPVLNISDFNDFKKAFDDASRLKSFKLLFIILDIFKANENWPDLVDGATKEEVLALQVYVGKIVKNYASTSENRSFDDIVALLLLQKLVWRCTVVYNEKAEDYQKMCESSYNLRDIVPKTVETILIFVGGVYSIFHNNIKNWRYHNTFDSSNVKIFKELIKEYMAKKAVNLLFEGPEDFCSPGYSQITFPSSTSIQQSISKIQDHEIVKNKLQEFKNSNDSNVSNHWKNKNEFQAKLEIAFYFGKTELNHFFPHFYNLMDTLAIIQSALVGKLENIKDYWIDQNHACYVYNYAWSFRFGTGLHSMPKDSIDIIRDEWKLVAPYKEECKYPASERDIFYRFRHSTVLTSKLNNTNYQVWLNYIKDANNARIFDSAYFQYITDHLLNNPMNYFDANYDYILFDTHLAKEIIQDMTKLIGFSLKSLNDDKDQNLTAEKRRKLALRAANISILLTRFINQLDVQEALAGAFCARSLAEIYKILQPYSKLISEFKLTDLDVSYINFAMFYTCSVRIRNSMDFMTNLNLNFVSFTGKPFRKTLEKFHWFLANTNFVSNGELRGVINDQFNFGIAGDPLKQDETDFMKYLLELYFIPKYKLSDPSIPPEFKFRSDGFIVEIHSSKPEDKDKSYLMINLAKGTIVHDGNSIVSTNSFVNSKVFQDFFKIEDWPLASSGLAVESGGRSIYYLPSFKGISYLLVHRNSIGGSGTGVITIHRKWNDKWYWSKSADECSNFIEKLNFNWIVDAKLFKRKDHVNAQYEEFLLFPDDAALEPLIAASINLTTGDLQMSVRGMTGNWTVVNDGFFDKHVRKIAEDDFILAKNDKGRAVAIYPGLRLPEDFERPLVLEEEEQTDGKYDFIVRNGSNMKICRSQALGSFYSLPGALVASNESKKVLLLPLIEAFKRSIDINKKETYKKLKQIQDK